MNTEIEMDIQQILQHPDSKRDYNKKLFKEVAPRYDFVTQALSFGRDRAWKRSLIEALPDDPNPACLDIACGTGDLSFLLHERFPNGRITGIDLTPDMLEIARQRLSSESIEFHQSDMCDLPFSEASLDIVTGGYALRNAPNLGTVLKEVHRVLRADGVAAFLEFSKPSNRIGQIFEDAALSVWGGFWGLVLHRDPTVYGYIAKSLREYPDRNHFRRIAEESGFRLVRSMRLFLGFLEITVLIKTTENTHA
ncbi:MAG TPA: hypothetical protein DEW46_16760 [Verrucomicrobia bacterium]|jgi:demethylmenaquinone methyltransferase/2-methoxy-6-polyprenyl-1,4-benzoquinol methylase|nr:hypothetical protein [Verrucomicrobiota bacterium]